MDPTKTGAATAAVSNSNNIINIKQEIQSTTYNNIIYEGKQVMSGVFNNTNINTGAGIEKYSTCQSDQESFNSDCLSISDINESSSDFTNITTDDENIDEKKHIIKQEPDLKFNPGGQNYGNYEWGEPCQCFPPGQAEPDCGPYYTHLGVFKSMMELRTIMQERCGVYGSALRIEKAKYCRREGKSSLGCPIAKYVIRR